MFSSLGVMSSFIIVSVISFDKWSIYDLVVTDVSL